MSARIYPAAYAMLAPAPYGSTNFGTWSGVTVLEYRASMSASMIDGMSPYPLSKNVSVNSGSDELTLRK